MLSRFYIGVAIIAFLGVMFWRGLQNDVIGNFLESHPHPKITPALQYSIGQIFFMIDKYEKAEQYYRKVIKQFPKSSQAIKARYMLIRTYENRHDFLKAKTEIRKFLNDYPDSKYNQRLKYKLVH